MYEESHDYAPIGDPQAMRIIELEKELSNTQARWEQKIANENVKELRRTGYCPTCGAEDQAGGRRW